MIRTFAIALALSTAFPVISGAPAYAQTAPDTDQTDRSEEDWRKSQKKRDTDINEIFQNKTIFGQGPNTGQGNGNYEADPMESLPDSSRRHLKRERAKVIAVSDPDNIPNAAYTPSEAAKSDPELAEQEKQVWDGMIKDMQTGGPGGGTAPGQQGAGQGQSSQGQQTAQTSQSPGQGQGQSQGQSQGGSGQSQTPNGQTGRTQGSGSPSPVRGGSSTSVSDILNKIKGMRGVKSQLPRGLPTGIPTGIPGGQNPFGKSPAGTGSEGSTPQGSGSDSGPEGRAPAGNAGKTGSDGQSEGNQSAQGDDAGQTGESAQSTSQPGTETPAEQSAGSAPNDAESQAPQTAQSQTPPASPLSQIPTPTPPADILGPLERMQQERDAAKARAETQARTQGTQNSAYDFLKKSEQVE